MYIAKQGGRADYNYKEIFLDTANELSEISTASFLKDVSPGSVAFVISTGAIYILNSLKVWILQG